MSFKRLNQLGLDIYKVTTDVLLLMRLLSLPLKDMDGEMRNRVSNYNLGALVDDPFVL